MKAKELKYRIGQKAQIKILKAKFSSYWYKNIIGKKIMATLIEEEAFADKKTFEWKVVSKKLSSGDAYINIEDAEIIKWHGGDNKKPSDKFTPRAVGFKKVKRGYKDIIHVRYEIVKGKKRIKDWIVCFDFGLPQVWVGYKVRHHSDGSGSTDRMVFQGRIPNNSFAKELFKNIF